MSAYGHRFGYHFSPYSSEQTKRILRNRARAKAARHARRVNRMRAG